MVKIKSVCIYCGSQPGNTPDFVQAAETLGAAIAKNNIRLVYGGGSRGIMGSVSNAARNNGGEVIGIIPRFLLDHEGEGEISANEPGTILTDNMHERKQKMFELSDAFIALPGGIGTLEEIFEIMTWAQLGRHEKPIGFLNTNGFWNPLLQMLDHMNETGFIHTASKVKPIVVTQAQELIPSLLQA